MHHKLIGAWLPPGGHLEPFELPHEAAVREAYEETGIRVEVCGPTLPAACDADAFFLPAPLCLHMVRAAHEAEDVYHLDLAYLCRLRQGYPALPAPIAGEGVVDSRWVRLDQAGGMPLARNVSQIIKRAGKSAWLPIS